jgi:signal peptidase I
MRSPCSATTVAHKVRQEYDTLEAIDDGGMNNAPPYMVSPDHLLAVRDNPDNSADCRFMSSVDFVPVKHAIGCAGFLSVMMAAEYPLWEVWEWPYEIRRDQQMRSIHRSGADH